MIPFVTKRATTPPLPTNTRSASRHRRWRNTKVVVGLVAALVLVRPTSWTLLSAIVMGHLGEGIDDRAAVLWEQGLLWPPVEQKVAPKESSPWQELTQKTPLPLPLQPPFRIIEVGRRRTGSTFQLHLLDAIAQMKTKEKNNQTKYDINFGYVSQDKRDGDSY